MGEVKRYVWGMDGFALSSPEDKGSQRVVMDEDYARLERERDHYKAFHDETMPVLEAAQGLRNRLESTERAMAAQASELSRLRAVEAAAMAYTDCFGCDLETVRARYAALAEACGRKG